MSDIYIPNYSYRKLTFIKSNDEELNQLQNTILMKAVAEKSGNKFKPLGQALSRSQYGYTASTKDTGNCRFLRITDITEGEIEWNDVPFCECSESDKYLISNGDILIARTGGTTGKTVIIRNVQETSVFASYLIRLSVKADYNPEFIYLFLNSYLFWNQILEMKQGTAQPNVNAEKMKLLMFPICSQDLQNQIVEFKYKNLHSKQELFNTIDQSFNKIKSINYLLQSSKKELNDQTIYLAKLRQSILQDAIEGKLTAEWRKQHPVIKGDPETDASALLKKIKAEKQKLIAEGKIKKEKPLAPIKSEEIPFELPEGWVWCRFIDITEIASNLVDPIKYKDSIQIAPDDIEKFTGKLIGDIRTVQEKKIMSGNHLFLAGMLLYSKVRPRLRKIIGVDFDGLCSADMYPLKPYINIEYLKSLMLSNYFDVEVNKFDNRVKMPKINQNQLSCILVPIPPEKEQHIIIENLNNAFEKLEILTNHISVRQQTMDELMQTVLREAFESK